MWKKLQSDWQKNTFSSNWWKVLVVLFLATRLFIWVFRPMDFSEIIYSYMPYAHLWANGTVPYREQWYEYPPLTIPLFYTPHLIDMATLDQPWHINYLQAYRLQLLLIDCAVFFLILRSLRIWGTSARVKIVAVIYYCLATAKAHHFIYDTMDFAFIAAVTLSISAPFITVPTDVGSLASLLSKPKELSLHVLSLAHTWLGYWMAFSLKLLNLPLAAPLWIIERRKWWISAAAAAAMAVVVLAWPLMQYRSSLQVILEYHKLRGLQVDSAAGVIVRVINVFTRSEKVIEVYKNYETSGPVTTDMLKISNVIFILSAAIFVAVTSWQAYQLSKQKSLIRSEFTRSFTFGFFMMIMVTGKVLSLPFMLWTVPLLALMPFDSTKEQLKFLVPAFVALALTLTGIPDFPIGPEGNSVDFSVLIASTRTLIHFWLLYHWCNWHQPRYQNSWSLGKSTTTSS